MYSRKKLKGISIMQRKSLPLVLLICMAMIVTSALAVFADAGDNGNGSLKVEYADTSSWNTAKAGQNVKTVKDKAFLLRVSEGSDVSVGGKKLTKTDNTAAATAINGIETSGSDDYYNIDTKSVGNTSISVKCGEETFLFTLQITSGIKSAGTPEWRDDKGNKYYYYDGVHYYQNTFATIDGDRYYFNSEGHLMYGAFKYKTGYYYLADTSTGVIRTRAGWAEDSGFKYYVQKGGKLYRSARVKIGSYYYCFRSDATLVTGQVYTVRGNYYYAGSNGVTKAYAGWVYAAGKTYRAGKGGVLIRSQRVKIGPYYYCFRANASMVKSQIYSVRGSYYYAGSNGVTKAYPGWVILNGESYYAGNGGRLYRAAYFVTGGKAYYTASDCSVVKYAYTKNGISVTPDPQTGATDMETYERVIYARSPYAYADYVLIDISDQNLRYYKGSKLILKTAVVTGKNGSRTPTGKFKVVSKTINTKLVGPGYVSYVKYWMAFVGSQVGMHDASWRSTFGGSIYVKNGSHGCVNMPTAAAKSLYSRVTAGRTIVIVRN